MGTRSATAAICIAISLPALIGSATAQELVGSQPRAAWFGGVGASLNALSLNQDLQGSGSTNVYRGGTLDSFGSSTGPGVGLHGSDNELAPEARLGYFENFAGSNWLWGFKLAYQYDGVSAAFPATIPQTGEFTIVGGGTLPFTGNYIIGSSQTRIRHQISLFPFLGHSFDNGFFYGGGGPMLLQMQSKLKNMVGLGVIYGQEANLTGPLMNFESSKWVWGAGVQAGMTYFLDNSWFIDLNYTFSRTQRFTDTFSTPFSNTFDIASFTYTTEGVANFSVKDQATTQAVSISINKAF